jgi:glycosyltransferase involved in cell wall biosynthesis
VQELGVERHITFHPPVPNNELPSYVRAADCVIAPSLCEGFGFAVAEASALEVTIVASNVDAIPELVSGKWILVEPGDPLALANGIIDAYHGRYIKTPVKRFPLEATIENYLKLYYDLHASKRGL